MEPTTVFIILAFIAFAWLSNKWTAKEVYKLVWFAMVIFAFCLLSVRYVEWKGHDLVRCGAACTHEQTTNVSTNDFEEIIPDYP